MNNQSGMVLLLGGSLVGAQFVHSGGWNAFEARVFHVDPGPLGNHVLAQDVSGHKNFLVLVGQIVVLAIMYVTADNDPQIGGVLIWFLIAMWFVFMVLSGWGPGALSATTKSVGITH
jgi:hypothetical protein